MDHIFYTHVLHIFPTSVVFLSLLLLNSDPESLEGHFKLHIYINYEIRHTFLPYKHLEVGLPAATGGMVEAKVAT